MMIRGIIGAMKIAVVIPAYNESKRIKDVLISIPKEISGCAVSVVAVDDGSKDETSAVASGVKGVKVIRHAINLGKGAAAKTGCDAACKLDADIIVLMDADGQHRPSDIKKMIEPLLSSKDELLVVGTRRINKKMPLTMRIGNWGIAELLKLFFKIKVSDSQSGFRAFRCSTYPKIRWVSPNYAMETEMLILASKHGIKDIEVGIDTIYHDNYKGTTIFDGMPVLKTILKWRFAWSQVSKSLEYYSH